MSINYKRKVESHPAVDYVDDERSIDNGIIVSLKAGYFYKNDPGCGVRGADTFKGCWLDLQDGVYSAQEAAS